MSARSRETTRATIYMTNVATPPLCTVTSTGTGVCVEAKIQAVMAQSCRRNTKSPRTDRNLCGGDSNLRTQHQTPTNPSQALESNPPSGKQHRGGTGTTPRGRASGWGEGVVPGCWCLGRPCSWDSSVTWVRDCSFLVTGIPDFWCRDTRRGYPGTLCFGYVLLVEERTRCTTSLDSVKHHVHYLVIL